MTTPSSALAERVRKESGENAYKCYQCKKCTSGCPVAGYADLHPAQIMRLTQLGDLDTVLASDFIWLCTGCETCTSRCPQSIDIATIMDEYRMIAWREKRVKKDSPFANVLKLNLASIKRWGRLYEVELLVKDKLTRPSSMMDDVGMGIKMFLKGKIAVMPDRGGDSAQMKRMLAEIDKIREERS